MNAPSTIQSLRGEIAQSLSVLKRLEDYFIVLRIRTLCLFWRNAGHEVRFAASWEMIGELAALRGVKNYRSKANKKGA